MKIIDIQKHWQQLPTLDIDLLLAGAIGQTREYIYAHGDETVSIWQRLRFCWYLFDYKRGYCVAAILEHKEFYGLDFQVNKKVLIPRPDTELLVATALEIIKVSSSPDNITLLDIGTGSGCIAIAILEALRPNQIEALGVDISRSAVRLARRNAARYKLALPILRGNLLEPIFKKYPGITAQRRLVITANLPYLTSQQAQTEPSIAREPRRALVANQEGLAAYEKLFMQIKKIPNSSAPLSLSILCEIDPSQAQRLPLMILNYFPGALIEIKNDLSGQQRLVIIRK